jgi:microcystin-dependent protein
MTSIFRMYNTYSTSAFGTKPTVGDTKLSLVGVDHLGWLLCDGRTLRQKDYYYLYQVIGTTYGSNASTTFNLPNPAGHVLGVIGSGIGSNGSNLTVRTAGQFVGEETHTLTIAEMPTHGHTINDSGHAHGYSNQPIGINMLENGVGTKTDVADNINTSNTTGSNVTGISINTTGGSNAHNTMQPTLFIGNMFIFCGLIEGKVPTQNNGMNYPFGGNGIY